MELDLNSSKKQQRKSLLIIGAILFAGWQSSCLDQEVRLTMAQINMVDSMYLAERKVWLDRLEDSCMVLREQQLDIWIDSLQTKRLREIEKMLGR